MHAAPAPARFALWRNDPDGADRPHQRRSNSTAMLPPNTTATIAARSPNLVQ